MVSNIKRIAKLFYKWYRKPTHWFGGRGKKVENEMEEPFCERGEATGRWKRKGGSKPNRLKATKFVSVVERRTRGTGCSR